MIATEKRTIFPFLTYSITVSPNFKYKLKKIKVEIVQANKSERENLRKFIFPKPAVKKSPFLTPKGIKRPNRRVTIPYFS